MTQEQKLQMYAALLPYELSVTINGDEHEHKLVGVSLDSLHIISPFGDYGTSHINTAKPIIRPMSDLTKEIVHEGYNDGKPFMPMLEIPNYCENEDDFQDIEQVYHDTNNMPYWIIRLLLKWHFNIFGLDETEYIVNE